MADGRPWTGNNGEHNDACHQRWAHRGNRNTGDLTYRDEWYYQQCGGCRFWIALRGELGLDYGACTNPQSTFDGHVRFEHDGCDVFADRDDHSFG